MTPVARLLSITNRWESWHRSYPGVDFWQPWHLGVMNHGGVSASQPPVTLMADLYAAGRPNPSRGASLLLRFEQRTLLGHLPSETRIVRGVPRALLDACAAVEDPADLHAFWGNLNSHVRKHLTPAERPHLTAVALAVRAEVRARGGNPDAQAGFFPREVQDAASYAGLARALLFLAVLPQSPLRFRLYSARPRHRAPYSALVLNIDVPEAFLTGHGQRSDREVVLGLHLAVADRVTVPGAAVLVPVLNTRVHFATLFAPDAPLSSRMRQPGRAATLYLQ